MGWRTLGERAPQAPAMLVSPTSATCPSPTADPAREPSEASRKKHPATLQTQEKQ